MPSFKISSKSDIDFKSYTQLVEKDHHLLHKSILLHCLLNLISPYKCGQVPACTLTSHTSILHLAVSDQTNANNDNLAFKHHLETLKVYLNTIRCTTIQIPLCAVYFGSHPSRTITTNIPPEEPI